MRPPAGIPEAGHFTLHGLSQGASQVCAAKGAGLNAIKEQGTWTSSAVHTYVPRQASYVVP